MQTNLREILDERVLIGDGSSGILLQERGICEDERFALANLTHPEEVKKVHEECIRAGAEVSEANTRGGCPRRPARPAGKGHERTSLGKEA